MSPAGSGRDPSPLMKLAAGIGGGIATVCFGATALCFGARQAVSQVAPGLLDSLGLGFLELVPAAPASVDTSTHDCTLSWWRDGFTTLTYRLSCTAEGEDIEISELHLAAIDTADWDSGAWTRDRTAVYAHEEQWPMADDVVHIEEGRTWTYNGSMSAGFADWLGGAPRALVWTAEVGHPERDDRDREKLCKDRSHCVVELVSEEPPR